MSEPRRSATTVRAFAAGMVLLAACSRPAPGTPPSPHEYSPTPADRLGVLAPNTGIPVGQKIPDVHGRDLEGHDVPLASAHAKGPVLLVFYRGGWCPWCNFEMRALTEAYPEFQKRGIALLAISVDKPDVEAKLRAVYSIPFPVLSDSDAAIIQAFHVVKTVGGAEGFLMKAFGVDLEASSGREHHQIAIPSLFLVDRAGIVRWAHSDPDFKVRPTTAQILAAVDASGVGTRP